MGVLKNLADVFGEAVNAGMSVVDKAITASAGMDEQKGSDLVEGVFSDRRQDQGPPAAVGM